jgi:hypothetical protein
MTWERYAIFAAIYFVVGFICGTIHLFLLNQGGPPRLSAAETKACFGIGLFLWPFAVAITVVIAVLYLLVTSVNWVARKAAKLVEKLVSAIWNTLMFPFNMLVKAASKISDKAIELCNKN